MSRRTLQIQEIVIMRLLMIGNSESEYCCQIKTVADHKKFTCDIVPFDQLASHLWANSENLRMASAMPTGSSIDSLQNYDVCLVRNMPGGSLEQIIFRMDLLWSLEAMGVKVINPPKAIECAVDKYLTLSRCQKAGLNVPETSCSESAKHALEMFHKMGEDIVLKPIFGAEGRGILRITEAKTARKVFNEWEQAGAVLYLQRFLKSGQDEQSDLRILMLNGDPVGAIQRTSSDDFRTNCALDAHATFHQIKETELRLAKQACAATGTIFAGVDLMYDQTGELYLLEVNACPGWTAFQQTTGIDVPAKLVNWLETLT